MHRTALLRLLERYLERLPQDLVRADPMRRFVRANADCFERSNASGHVTASAWIVSHDRSRYLLTHHRKLGRWLQLGGHADGDPDALAVALREAREESGMPEFEVFSSGPEPIPLDVDIHRIPATAQESEHLHYDVRFLLIAAPGQELLRSSESIDLRWFPLGTDEPLAGEASLLRMAARARQWLQPHE